MKTVYAILAVLLASLVSSCRTVKYVPVERKLETRDSVVIRDSTVIRDVVNYRDSVVTRDSTVLVLDESGNVIRTELYRQKEVYRELQKEYDALLERYKSLEARKTDSIPVPYPVEKELTAWQQTKVNYGGWAMVIVFVFILVVVGKMVYKLKK